MDMQREVTTKFKELYNEALAGVFFAPGRVNLIGEHIDYNGGHVFPCGITQGTYVAIGQRDDRAIHCYSMNFSDKGIMKTSLDQLVYAKEDGWINYVKGIVKYLQEASNQQLDGGFNLVVYSNIPNGAGLSSSASIELAVGLAVDQIYGLAVDRLTLIKLGQRVENEFFGLNTGIMDQFAIGMAQADQAIFLDTNTLEYSMVPTDFKDHVILIMNTNQRRELADSKYNKRRQQCEQALADLQTELDIQTLGDLSSEAFEQHKQLITDEVLRRRAKHAVYENERTLQAKEALTAGDLSAFGKLLDESHRSLRDDYEITGEALDTIVSEAWQQESVLGARMTGAGMGGCAIALVHKDQAEAVIQAIGPAYQEAIGLEAEFYIAEVGDGAKALS
ncbi:galactokinase [Dolosigranulum pigrum]|uniref:galactokinase n=1 Tax=Dolosigranulum pigrum TaxID=29394 RepID=UPI000DC04FE3|nr:galactokinase [Dolosigranulum pigrum]RAN55043.1 galactokinase [Dolosigranulum pigrum]VTU58553.1 galactokinase [Lactobacillus farciminis KCTC 3681 = DSM] [Dolosigranulum pigrum]